MFTSQEWPASQDRAPSSRGSAPLVDPVFVVRRVWRAKWWILLLAILGTAIGVMIALSIPRTYFASTDLIVDPRGINLVQNEVTQTPLGLASDAALALIQSQIAVITSSSVLDRVVDEAGLTQDPEFNGTAPGPFDRYLPSIALLRGEAQEVTPEGRRLITLNNLRRRVTAGRSANSFVIYVTVESVSPTKAADLANTIADIFVEEQVRAQAATARNATVALTERLVELRRRVGEAEEAVERYRAENQLLGIGGRLIDDEFILRINNQLATVRAEITGLNVRAQSMSQTSVDDVVQGTFPEELSSPSLVRLRQTFAEVQQQNAVLAARLGPRHPQRIASEQSLTSSRQAIAGELARIVSAAQTELARAQETERELTTQIESLRGQQFETSESFVGLRELERDVDASRAVYEAYLLRSREIGEQESLNTLNVRTISEATPPIRPGGSSRRLIVAAGGILGLGLGIGLAVLFALGHLLRTRMNQPEPATAAPSGGASGSFERPVWTALPPPPARPAASEPAPEGAAAHGEAATPASEPNRAQGAADAEFSESAATYLVRPAAAAPSDETPAVAAEDEDENGGEDTTASAQTPSADEPVVAASSDALPESPMAATPSDSPTVDERRERLRQRIRQIGTRRHVGAPPLDDAHVSEAIRRLTRNDRTKIAELRARRDAEKDGR